MRPVSSVVSLVCSSVRYVRQWGRGLALAVALTAWAPSTAHAQFCLDTNPCAPPSTQVAPSTVAATESSIMLTVYASDDNGLAVGSWQLWRNGINVSSWLTGKIDNAGALDQTLVAVGSFALDSGSNVIVSRICESGNGARCIADTVTVIYTAQPPPAALPATAAPIVTLAQRNDARLLDACATCASGTASYSTPAFFFNGNAVSTTLYYSTELARPTGFVELDVRVPASAAPGRLSVRLFQGSTNITLSNGAAEGFVGGTTAPVRIGAQFAADAMDTQVLTMSAQVSATWGSTVTTTTLTGIRALIQKVDSSVYGRGWVVAGDERLHIQTDSSLLLADGAGGLAIYPLIGCTGSPSVCTYTAPKGDYTTLVGKVRTSDNTRIWERTERTGGRTVWGATGLMEGQFGLLGDSMTVERVASGDPRIARLRYWTQVGSTVINKNITFAYSGGQLSSITLPDGRVSQFQYAADKSLIRVTDPDGMRAMTASYTAGRLTALAGRDTASTLFEYDAFGQLKAVVGPSVLVKGETFARERTTIHSLRHRLLDSLATSVGATAKAATPLDSAVQRAVDHRGTSTTVWGHVSGAASRTESRSSTGQTEFGAVTFDADYRPIAESGTGRAGQTFTWSGPLLTRSDDLLTGRATEYFHSTLDRLDSVRVAAVRQLRHYYTGASFLPDSTRTDSANVVRYTYDTRGRVLTVRDATNTTVTTTYETTHGNPVTATRTASGAATVSTSRTFDPSGRPITATDPLSRVFTTSYDSLNRVTRTDGPLSATTLRTYDDSAGVYTVRDPMMNLYTTVVNARGWVIKQQDPRGNIDSVRYDTLGRVTRSWSRRGDVVALTYDDFDRVLTRIASAPSGTPDTATFAYDAGKRWWMVKNAESIDSFFVDVGGRGS